MTNSHQEKPLPHRLRESAAASNSGKENLAQVTSAPTASGAASKISAAPVASATLTPKPAQVKTGPAAAKDTIDLLAQLDRLAPARTADADQASTAGPLVTTKAADKQLVPAANPAAEVESTEMMDIAGTDDVAFASPLFPDDILQLQEWQGLCLKCGQYRFKRDHAPKPEDCQQACFQCGNMHEFGACEFGNDFVERFRTWLSQRYAKTKAERAEKAKADKEAKKAAAAATATNSKATEQQGADGNTRKAPVDAAAATNNAPSPAPANNNGGSGANESSTKKKKKKKKNTGANDAPPSSNQPASDPSHQNRRHHGGGWGSAVMAKDLEIQNLKHELEKKELHMQLAKYESASSTPAAHNSSGYDPGSWARQHPSVAHYGPPSARSASYGYAPSPPPRNQYAPTNMGGNWRPSQYDSRHERSYVVDYDAGRSTGEKRKVVDSGPAAQSSARLLSFSKQELQTEFQPENRWVSARNIKGENIFIFNAQDDLPQRYLPPGWTPIARKSDGRVYFINEEHERGFDNYDAVHDFWKRNVGQGFPPPLPRDWKD